MLTAEEKRERAREACRKWRLKNLERERQRDRDRFHTNKEYETARTKEWFKANPDRVRELNRQSYARNKQNFTAPTNEMLMWKASRVRAKRKGVPHTITVNDITIPEYCPVLGIHLERGVGRFSDASPTLDRIKPELGYIKGNVAVISHRANTIKSCGSLEEHQQIVNWLSSLLS